MNKKLITEIVDEYAIAHGMDINGMSTKEYNELAKKLCSPHKEIKRENITILSLEEFHKRTIERWEEEFEGLCDPSKEEEIQAWVKRHK